MFYHCYNFILSYKTKNPKREAYQGHTSDKTSEHLQNHNAIYQKKRTITKYKNYN